MGRWNPKSIGVCTPYPASYQRNQELLGLEKEDQSVTGTTKEKATPEERYLVSGARIRLFVFSPEGDLKKFDEMSFQD